MNKLNFKNKSPQEIKLEIDLLLKNNKICNITYNMLSKLYVDKKVN